jgi:hypothetical protein
MKRCPLHGPIPDEDATTCPGKLRRQIGGTVEEGSCGLVLVDDVR